MIGFIERTRLRRRWRAVVFAALLALVGHPSSVVTTASAHEDTSSAPRGLSAKQRGEVFEKIWSEIRKHYYDTAFNGVDWDDVHAKYLPRAQATENDAAFYALMSEMTGELHDAHTRFSSPEQWRNFRRQQRASAGLAVDEIDGQPLVTSVAPDSSAAHAGVEPGMIVLSLDGDPVQQRLAEAERKRAPSSSNRATRMLAYGSVFGGPPNSTLRIGLKRTDGSEFVAVLTRHLVSTAPEVATDVLPSGFGYIRFDGFQPNITSQFRRALRRFRNSPGIVLDLRRNGGGDLAVLLSIAGYFFDKKTLFARDSTRSGKPLKQFAGLLRLPLELYVARTGNQIYSGPVVILVGPRSASSSEVFAAGMQDTRRARIVGAQTCGCVLGVAKPRTMKGGGVLEMSEVVWFSPNGRRLEGSGIVPDEEILPTAADFQHKRDAVLLQAERVLRHMGGERRIARE